MFTAVAHKNLADAEKYFDEHLAQNDYYAAGEIRPGQWIGAGAERLGLTAGVTRDQFHALCENLNPDDSERLTQRSQKEGQRPDSPFANSKPSPPRACVSRTLGRIERRAIRWPQHSYMTVPARLTRSCTRISRCSKPRSTRRSVAGRRWKRAACMTRFIMARRSIGTNWPNGCNKLATGFNRPDMDLKSRV